MFIDRGFSVYLLYHTVRSRTLSREPYYLYWYNYEASFKIKDLGV